ncbi:transforming growth factor beta-2 proprotein-like [Anneissia japonica]|uniref:transforming growth factor beta-2 proprotein-like n=1 Tax=Anneissia japonica TaxID=1529436 RepID=UPI00142569BB|nr:transforming growth factor beta-2 proprotein-like [Anneissia japonica]
MNLYTFLNYNSNTSIFGKMPRRTTMTMYCFALVFIVCFEICSSSQCMLDIYQYETKRTAAIRGQILSKLGMTVPPKDSGPEIIPKEDEEKWNETQRILDEQWSEKLEACHKYSSEDEYYAKLTKTYSLEKDWPRSTTDEHFKKYYEENQFKYSMFYKFNISDLQRMSKSIEITEAQLRIFKANRSEATVEEQHIELFSIESMNNSTPVRRFLGASVVNTKEDEWLTFDVREAIQRSFSTCDNLGFELTTHCDPYERQKLQIALAGPSQQTRVPSQGVRGDTSNDDETTAQYFLKPGSHPTLIVFYSATPNAMSGNIEETTVQLNLSPGSQSYEDERDGGTHHRTRRNDRRRRTPELNEDFCDYETSKRCCLREFYIDFEKHLNWRWIRRPRGYRANFCAGSCPYMWGTDVMNTQVIGLYKKMNPDASPSPCCVSKNLKPLSILYYEGNKPIVTKLTDMITTSCKCS